MSFLGFNPDSMAAYYAEQYWPDPEFGQDGADELQGVPNARCKYCGTRSLEWRNTDEGWRLFNKRGAHSCKRYAAAKAKEAV